MIRRDDAVWQFDDVRVDTRAGQVWKGEQLVELEPKAFDVLCHLVARPGQLVSKQELFDTVWNGVAVTDNALTRVVAQLRKAIGDDSRQARYIETVPTRGYRFIASVSESPAADALTGGHLKADGAMADGLAAAPLTPPATPMPDGPAAVAASIGRDTPVRFARRRGDQRRPWLILAVSIAVVLAAGWAWQRSRSSSTGQPGDDRAGSSAAPFELTSVEQTTFTVGLDTFPTFSPDGGMLAFSSNRHGGFELFAKSFAPGSTDRQITQDGQQNVQPHWSPDGRLIAYHSMARGGVWTVPASGGASRQVADVGGAPSWSPDGGSIVYQTAEISSIDELGVLPPSSLQIVSMDTGAVRSLTQPGRPIGGHSQPSWSPDGRRVVFLASTYYTAEIWTVTVADGALKRLLVCSRGCKAPTISPDGQWLYYGVFDPVKSMRRVRLSADGESVVEPTIGMSIQAGAYLHGFALSRDGARIAFGVTTVRSGLSLVRLRPDASPATSPETSAETITHDTSRRNAWPTFSSDGQRLLYTSWRSGQGQQAWVMNADGSRPEQITSDDLLNVAPSWLPGDREVAYQLRHGDEYALRALDLVTRRTRALFSFGPATPAAQSQYASPRLMRDGRHLVHGRFIDGHSDIWVTDLQTRASRQLVHNTATANFPIGSMDGRWVAYETYEGASMQLAVVRFDGTQNRILTSGRGLTWPNDFSPDSTRIVVAYRRDGVWNIGWMSRDGGPLHPLTAFTSSHANGFVRYPSWSPKDDRIVFEHSETEGNLWIGTLAAARPGTN